jgi:hypothetical protein
MSSRLVFAALQRQLATQLIIDDDSQLEQNFEAMQLQFQVAEKSAPHLFGLGTFYLERKKDDEGCCGCCYSSKKEPMFSLITDSGSLAQLQAAAEAAASRVAQAVGEEAIQRDLGMEDITSFAEETKLRALGGTRASILDGMCQRQTLPPHGTRF